VWYGSSAVGGCHRWVWDALGGGMRREHSTAQIASLGLSQYNLVRLFHVHSTTRLACNAALCSLHTRDVQNLYVRLGTQ
jgi:hypothetical protein